MRLMLEPYIGKPLPVSESGFSLNVRFDEQAVYCTRLATFSRNFASMSGFEA